MLQFLRSSLQYPLNPRIPLTTLTIEKPQSKPMNVTYSGSVQQSKLDIHGGGLVGLQGAKRVIELLHSHASIKHVVLGNNAFGDDGIVALFAYLTTPMASKLRIVEMSLNSCKIGNDGLEALCRYLDGNTSLRKLYLQNNLFNPSLELATTFTRAINNSQLRTLSLTSNPQLSDAFVFRFLPNLSTPYMHELHLSAMGITPISTPYISDFLASDKPSSSTSAVTRVRDLRLNGNKLSLRCVGQIVKTLERYSYSVLHLEIYANDFERIGEGTDFLPMAGVSTSPNTSSIPPSPDTSYLDEAEEDDEQVQTWQHYNRRLVQVFARNHILTKGARRSALSLLMPARMLLLPPSVRPPSSPTRPTSGFPWRSLPTELQLHILTFLAPTLSPAQRIRIFKFAEDRSTLPSVGIPNLLRVGERKNKEELRDDWLVQVGCDRFEPYLGWLQDFRENTLQS